MTDKKYLLHLTPGGYEQFINEECFVITYESDTLFTARDANDVIDVKLMPQTQNAL